ncbi:MAG: DNA-binding protein WhiA [Acutalibacteraceae bacterium]|nr:DNA-binding protein WhiA [Acutalibacteraceae bacterium]
MSFSADTKKELCKTENININESIAECYGMLIFCRKFTPKELVFTTESYSVASRACELLSTNFGVIVEQMSVLTGRHGGGKLFTITVPLQSDCEKIYTYFGYTGKEVNHRINRAITAEENCASAFLRGAFLSCGSINNPEKDYHLEYTVPYKHLCSDLLKIVEDTEQLNFTFKLVERKGSYIAYLKDSENISDFLAFINAPLASMEIMNTKILKEYRNNINRKVNSEVANIKKTVAAATEQITAIEKIKDTIGFESLNDDLQALAKLRLENPELSLRALGEMLEPPISRSGVNHRMKKLIELAK